MKSDYPPSSSPSEDDILQATTNNSPAYNARSDFPQRLEAFDFARRQGNCEATLCSFYDLTGPYVHSIVNTWPRFEKLLRVYAAKDLIRDIQHDGYCAFIGKLKASWNTPKQMWCYIKTILRFKAIDRAKQESSDGVLSLADMIDQPSTDHHAMIDSLTDEQAQAMLQHIVDGLNEDDLCLFELAFLQGLSNLEIAEYLKIDDREVKNQKGRLVYGLRQQYSRLRDG